jgi:capsular polysaccharide export protein
MRLWKRRPLAEFFKAETAMVFDDNAARAAGGAETTERPLMVWAGKEQPAHATHRPPLRGEDGFLRSRGLGAELVPPLSLVHDDLGIYYDPTRESRLERHIAAATTLPDHARDRAARLIAKITEARLGKYNLDRPLPAGLDTLPDGPRILVPGQVEDDASIRLGTTSVATNLDLLKRVRANNPNAVIIYKPHPDVEAGLRDGRIPPEEAAKYANLIADQADPIALLDHTDALWTMTSTMGFEALLRGIPVTTFGAPFYAGWGLTTDLGSVPARRGARPSLLGLLHASLIDYPRYLDPMTGAPCPVEVAIERLAQGQPAKRGPLKRALSKLQGAFSTHAHLWRR